MWTKTIACEIVPLQHFKFVVWDEKFFPDVKEKERNYNYKDLQLIFNQAYGKWLFGNYEFVEDYVLWLKIYERAQGDKC